MSSTPVQIGLTFEGRTAPATLLDHPTARAFAAQLPLTVTVKAFGAAEKIADLPSALPTDGAPAAATPSAGDIGYYAPWGNLAVYHRDVDRSPGLVVLGSLDDDPTALAGLPDGAVIVIALLD